MCDISFLSNVVEFLIDSCKSGANEIEMMKSLSEFNYDNFNNDDD